MKPKKFSQIYREAAEMLNNDKSNWNGCKHYIIKICRPVRFPHHENVNDYFGELFNEVHRGWYDFGSTGSKEEKQHRITALLLASEIAKSEGL